MSEQDSELRPETPTEHVARKYPSRGDRVSTPAITESQSDESMPLPWKTDSAIALQKEMKARRRKIDKMTVQKLKQLPQHKRRWYVLDAKSQSTDDSDSNDDDEYSDGPSPASKINRLKQARHSLDNLNEKLHTEGIRRTEEELRRAVTQIQVLPNGKWHYETQLLPEDTMESLLKLYTGSRTRKTEVEKQKSVVDNTPS